MQNPPTNRVQSQHLSGVPRTHFNHIQEEVAEYLRNQPDNSVGLAGPHGSIGHRARFSAWVANYLDSGIGQQYWSPQSGGAWEFKKDRSRIIEFFRGLVIVTAEAERKARLDRTRGQGTMTAKRAKEAGFKSKGLEENEEKEKEEEKEEEGGMNMELDEQVHNEDGSLESKLLNDDEEMYQPPSLAISTKKTSPRNLSSAQPSTQTTPFSTSKQEHSSKALQQGPVLGKRRRGRPKKGETLARASVSVNSGTSPLLDSARQYALEGTPLPLPKRLRQLEPTSPGVIMTRSTVRRDNAPLSITQDRGGSDRVFETRLGEDKTIAFLFAPLTISFQDFCVDFCKVWRKDFKEMKVEDVGIMVSISGVGEYQLSFGKDRIKSWVHIMKLSEKKPESNILVTVSGYFCG